MNSKTLFVITIAVSMLNGCGGARNSSDDASPPPTLGNGTGNYVCVEGLKESLANSTVQFWETDIDESKNCGTGRGMAIAQDKNGNIFIGGRFDRIGTLKTANIAMYSSSSGTWSTLGSGIEKPTEMKTYVYDNPVNGLVVSGNTLYVTGNFNKAGDVATTNIAKWNIDTKTWSRMDSCIPGRTNERLTADEDGTLYSDSGCKWDGSSWSRIRDIKDLIGPIVLKDKALYTTINDHFQTFSIKDATWTNDTKDELDWKGSGYAPHFRAIVPGQGSELYVAGTFTKIGNVAAQNIAKWDGTTWSALGPGIDTDAVDAIAVHSSGVYFSTRWDWGPGSTDLYKWDGSQITRVMLPGMLKTRLAPAAMLPVGNELWLVGNDGIIVRTPFDQFQSYQE